MADAKVNTFFISEKISKVRWVPEQLRESERFLTGSWDMPKNFLRIWRLHRNQYDGSEYNEFVPRCSDKLAMNGDVTGIEFVTDDTAVVSCSDGRVTLFRIKKAVEEDVLLKEANSELLHSFIASGKCSSCSSISVYGKDVATVGEDGRLNIVDTQAHLAVRRSIEADSCSLLSVLYVNPQEVLTANRMGIIRMFDIRSSSDGSATTAFMTSCEDEKRCNYVSCLTSHPTQPHVVMAGSEEGSITVWDLRNPGYPASYLSAHTSPITDIGFHRSDPSKLFTTAEAGELWLWAQHPTMSGGVHRAMEPSTTATENTNPWLNGERAKNRISVTALMTDLRKAINSFDTQSSKIICGSDSEAIYFVDNVL
ncbi:nucleoporin Nup43 [Musca domestica]|uniref:Nucleoporin Nup43 n=1 Tax=Musca domestica TaxID=7370 RepID=A0A9J7CX14_MUSDO|nr:nucleoporin Nup43 [Musca domestica]